MPRPLFLVLQHPIRSFKLGYTFAVQALGIFGRRLALPYWPEYQSLRTQLTRAYMAAANLHLPGMVYHTPVTNCPDEEARPVNFGSRWKGYLIPGTHTVPDLQSLDWRSRSSGNKAGIVLYAHGGGFARGEARMYRGYMRRWVAAAKQRGIDLVFLSVEYPLSGESPHPSQRDSFISGYKFLLEQGVKANQILFMGDSAGATLSVLTSIEAMRANLPQPAGSILISPWMDYSLETYEGGNALVESDYLVHGNTVIPEMIKAFLGGADGTSPDVNPLYRKPEDLRGLNPQLILAGAAEFPMQDARAWAKLCKESGVKCEAVFEWGQLHMYALGHSWLSPTVRDKTDAKIVDWIDKCLS